LDHQTFSDQIILNREAPNRRGLSECWEECLCRAIADLAELKVDVPERRMACKDCRERRGPIITQGIVADVEIHDGSIALEVRVEFTESRRLNLAMPDAKYSQTGVRQKCGS
jgi:hypothetical protein